MAERLTPGVYIEEPPSAVRPIQGAATSTAGFLGEAERGIPGRATFVRSTSDYLRFFGGLRRGPAGHLAAAVQAFFEAGGRRAYVVRVLPGNAAAGASRPVTTVGPDTWGVTRQVLRVRAKGTGAWSSSLRIHLEPSTSAVGPAFRLRVERLENGRARTLETFDELRMDSEHPDYVGVAVNEVSQYVEVDDLFRQNFLDAEERTDPPLPEVVAALTSVEPTEDGDRFAVPRRAVLQFRWRDSVGQTGSPGSAEGRGVDVAFNRPDTPGTVAGDDVLLTTDELTAWLTARLGDDFRVIGSRTPGGLTSTEGPWDTTGGTTSSFTLDGTGRTVTYTERTPAALELGTGPFTIAEGDVLELTVNGEVQEHTIAAGEVTDGAATPDEVATVLNTAFTGIQAFTDPNLRIRTDARGPAASLAVTGTTAAAFGSPAAAAGAGNVADPGAVTPAELADAVNALGLPLRAEVAGAAVVIRFTDSADHTLDWTADPGPDDILAATDPVTSPVPGGPVTVEPAVASRAYAVATFPGTTLDLSAAGTLRVVASSGALSRTASIDIPAPGNAAVAVRDLAERITASFAALEATEADRLLVTAQAAGTRLVVTAPARSDGVTLRLEATGTEPWTGVPAVRDGAGGTVVDDERAVEITVGEPIQAGVARALPRLFRQARATGRAENDAGGPGVLPAETGDTPLRLLGGSDGTGSPGLSEFRAALRSFDPVDIGLLAAPGRTDGGFVSALSAYADAWDVFYVADGPGSDDRDFELTADDARRHVEGLPARSRNAGMFYPWVEVPDPVGIGRDPRRYVPPSGHVAGVFARTDLTRGVWKAPAGVEAVVSGAVGLQHRLVDGDQDLLNPIGLNCLRQFPTAGIVTWGSRTLATESDPAWRYVPVRRTALFLKESLRRGLQWAVFEPNDEDLWTQITLNVTAFMLGLFRQGAFQGTTPAEAFLVQCDRDTNPQELVDQGIVTTRVAFAPLKPAEFVVVELTQKSLVAL
jgi:phage tail sheath protein FI